MTIDWWALEQRKPPNGNDIKKEVAKVKKLPDAGDHGHVVAQFPIYNKKMPPVPQGSWNKAKQKPVKLSKLSATNQQLNRTNLIWHLENPGKSRFSGKFNTHPQVLQVRKKDGSKGKKIIVDGHHRLSAEKLLGLKKDMCWVLDQKDI